MGEGGQVIPLHPRRNGQVEQIEQPIPAVVIPLYPARRGDVAALQQAAQAGLLTYVVDWPAAS